MTVDTRVICTVEDCIYNDGEEGCLQNDIRIKGTIHADAPAMCAEYEENEE